MERGTTERLARFALRTSGHGSQHPPPRLSLPRPARPLRSVRTDGPCARRLARRHGSSRVATARPAHTAPRRRSPRDTRAGLGGPLGLRGGRHAHRVGPRRHAGRVRGVRVWCVRTALCSSPRLYARRRLRAPRWDPAAPRRVRASPPVLRVHLHHRGGPGARAAPRPTVLPTAVRSPRSEAMSSRRPASGSASSPRPSVAPATRRPGFVGCRGFDAYCPAPDGARILAEGARYAHSSGCGTCLCSSGQWESPCDRRGCE